MRVDDVLAADVGARGREREVVRLDHGRDPVVQHRVLDAGSPGGLGQRGAAGADVAAGVDRVVLDPARLEQLAAAVDRPALDEARGVDLEERRVTGVEEAARLLAQLVAAREHPADVVDGTRPLCSSPRLRRLISLPSL